MGLKRVKFEVFGTVQGVYFRAYTVEYAKSIGIKGWVQNTNKGTVVGEFEGENSEVEKMKIWLRHTGSPASRIRDATFGDLEIERFSFNDFNVGRY